MRETSLDTREEVEHFRLFFVFLAAGLVDLGSESLDFPNSRLGQHLLREKSKSENFGLFALSPRYFFICCLAAPWPTFGCYRGNSLIHPMLITAFGLSVFVPELNVRVWVSTPN